VAVTAVAALLGALTGAFLAVAVAAWRGALPRPTGTAGAATARARRMDRAGTRAALAASCLLVVAVATRWPVAALLAGAAGFAAPSLTGGAARRERELERVEAIASWAEMLRDTLAGAGGLEQSIIATAAVAPEPIRPQVRQLAARLEHQRLSAGLRQLADDLDDRTADLVVAALLLAAERGPSRLADLLGDLAAATRGEVTMRLRVEAGRARVRASMRIITVFTALFTAGLVALNRPFLAAYDDPLGQAVLALVALCYVSAYAWMARASRAGGTGRLLGPAAPGAGR